MPVALGYRHPEAVVDGHRQPPASTLWVTAAVGPEHAAAADRRTRPNAPFRGAAVEIEVETVGALAAGDALRHRRSSGRLAVTGRPQDAELLVWALPPS